MGVFRESCELADVELVAAPAPATKLRFCPDNPGELVAPADEDADEVADGCCWLPTISSF